MNSVPKTPEEYRFWWAQKTDEPYGFCWCGCGEKTPQARQSDSRKLCVNGEPRHYLPHHYKRESSLTIEEYRAEWHANTSVPYGLCQCGCGVSTDVWPESNRALGRVRGEPKRCIRGHMPPRPRPRLYPERYEPRLCGCGCGVPTGRNRQGRYPKFLSGHQSRKSPQSYVVEDRGYNTPCWIWQLSTHKLGYGTMWDSERMVYAHRLYYERASGAIPIGKELDHLCRQRSCVNPNHLEPVTHAENCQRGFGTLSKEQAKEIRQLRESQGLSYKAIGNAYGVSLQTVFRIVKGLSWRD